MKEPFYKYHYADPEEFITSQLTHSDHRHFHHEENTEPLPIKEKKKIFFFLPPFFILTMIFFYYEMILKIIILHSLELPEILFIFLSSMMYGAIIYLFTSFSKNENRNRRWRQGFILGFALWFLTNYFIYSMFNIFYDIPTIFAGAHDALGQFQGSVMSMIFSKDGMIMIILYMIPSILYLLFKKRIDNGKKANYISRIFIILITLFSYLITVFSISSYPSYKNSYHEEYNYGTAINNFGLMTALRLDIENMIIPFQSSFQAVAEEPIAEETAEPTPVIYDMNELDIDFDALASSGTSIDQEMDAYVQTLTASSQNEYTGMFQGKNLIMITAEAFSGDLIDPELTPTLYRLANQGIQFTDYYQPASAGTTGGEYEILFGMMPTNGGTSLKNMSTKENLMTIGSQLDRQNYAGWAFHNNTATFYSRDVTHNNLGYSNGFMGLGTGMEQYVTSQWPESDVEMFEGTYPLYSESEPFNIYYMTVSGHNGYSIYENAMTQKHWDEVQDLPYNDDVKGYIAANLELEDALTSLVDSLEEQGIADDTVIVLSGDHFPYGLDYGNDVGNLPNLSNLYGYEVTNYLQRDHNRLIVWSGSLEDEDPIVVDTPTSSIDILPTLSNLFGLPYDSRLFPGRDVFSDTMPLVFLMTYDWKTDLGTYYASTGTFVANDGAVIPEGYVDKVRTIVQNKMIYCKDFNSTDYFAHVFGDYDFPVEEIKEEKINTIQDECG